MNNSLQEKYEHNMKNNNLTYFMVFILVLAFISNLFLALSISSAVEKVKENSNVNSARLEEQSKRIQLALKEQRVQSRALDCLINAVVTKQEVPNIRDAKACRESAKELTRSEPFFNTPAPSEGSSQPQGERGPQGKRGPQGEPAQPLLPSILGNLF